MSRGRMEGFDRNDDDIIPRPDPRVKGLDKLVDFGFENLKRGSAMKLQVCSIPQPRCVSQRVIIASA